MKIEGYTPCVNTLCVAMAMEFKLTSKLSKAARALAGWTSAELSEHSEVPHDTIRAFESGRTKSLTTMNERAIIKAFETAGIDFIPENGGGSGVRLRDRSAD